MSRGFLLYDDAVARAADPFALTRPFGEMRAGALLIRERWARVLGSRATGRLGAPHLAGFDEFGAPRQVNGTLKAGSIIVNSRFAPMLDVVAKLATPGACLRCDGDVAAVSLKADTPAALFDDGSVLLDAFATRRSTGALRGWWLNAAWDLVATLPAMLASDCAVLASEIEENPSIRTDVLGENRFAVVRGAYVEPQVVVDTTAGAVVVMDGARISAFARIAGPCVIGPKVQMAGGRYSCVSVGENSRVCGEMSVVIFTGHSNKGHDGFLGHSVLGRWANLGAGTTTSNLKNSYGKIRVEDSQGEHETGLQFLGSLIGDHAKTAIGTRLNTGTIVGAGANVFGDRSPAKFVPPFAWGDQPPFERYERAKFIEVAEHVMHRRDVALSDGVRETLGAAWDLSRKKRR